MPTFRRSLEAQGGYSPGTDETEGQGDDVYCHDFGKENKFNVDGFQESCGKASTFPFSAISRTILSSSGHNITEPVAGG